MQPKDQVVIDELSSHTDLTRQELIHPYKVTLATPSPVAPPHHFTVLQTIYGRDLNSVLKDNLGCSWEEACATLMCEMRMYELECLRR